jgi:hypothetical protein
MLALSLAVTAQNAQAQGVPATIPSSDSRFYGRRSNGMIFSSPKNGVELGLIGGQCLHFDQVQEQDMWTYANGTFGGWKSAGRWAPGLVKTAVYTDPGLNNGLPLLFAGGQCEHSGPGMDPCASPSDAIRAVSVDSAGEITLTDVGSLGMEEGVIRNRVAAQAVSAPVPGYPKGIMLLGGWGQPPGAGSVPAEAESLLWMDGEGCLNPANKTGCRSQAVGISANLPPYDSEDPGFKGWGRIGAYSTRIGTNIFTFGGVGNLADGLSMMQKWAWRFDLTAFQVDGVADPVHRFGGCGDMSKQPQVQNECWSRIADMPRARAYMAGATLESRNLVVLAGGSVCDPDPEKAWPKCEMPFHATDTVDVFHADSNTWSTAAPLKAGRTNMLYTLLAGTQLVLAGGMSDPNFEQGIEYNTTEVYDITSGLLAQSSSSVRAHDEERSDERRRAKNHCRSKVLLVITARDTHRAHTPYGVTPVGGTPRRARGRYSTHTLHSVIVIPQHPPRNRDGKRPIHTQITHTDQALGAPPALGSLVEPPPAMASGAPPAI